MSANKPSIPKGMRDFNSDVMQKRNYIFETVKTVFECYGYAPIETPAMENINTLTGKYGDEGKPIVEANPDHEISKIYLGFAEKIKKEYL